MSGGEQVWTTVISRFHTAYTDEYDTLREALGAMYGQSENMETGYPEKVICPDGTEITDPGRWSPEALYYPEDGYRITADGKPQTQEEAAAEVQQEPADIVARRLEDSIALVQASGLTVIDLGDPELIDRIARALWDGESEYLPRHSTHKVLAALRGES